MITAKGLLSNCQKIMNEHKSLYMWGTYGSLITEELIEGKVRQYPDKYSKSRQKTLHNNIGKAIGCDCCGLIKNYYFGGIDNFHYMSKYDRNVTGWLNSCTQVGSINNLPEVPGLALFMNGHIGIYKGNGEAYECTLNTIKQLDGVIVSKVKGRGWTQWGYLPEMDYSEIEKLSTPYEFPLRSAPSSEGKIYLYIPANAIITILKKNLFEDINGKWDLVEYDGQKGYMLNTFLQASETPMIVTPNVGLWYHSSFPCSDDTRISVWSKGTIVNVISGWSEKDGGYTWVKVNYAGRTVYAASEYLTKV